MDQVLVTGALLGKSRFDILQGTSILSGDELSRRIQASLGETLSYLPGVSSTFFGPGASRPVIRGLSGDRIAVLLGGIGSIDASSTSPDHAVASDPLTATRIEVIRGPATLLYGSSAVGGVINVIDGRIPVEQPANGASGAARLEYGVNANDKAAGGTLDVGAGKFVFHVDGSIRDSGDYRAPGLVGGNKVANSGLNSKDGSLGSSYIWDTGFLGLSYSRTASVYGVPNGEDPPVHIDLKQDRVDLMGEQNGNMGPFEKAKLRFGWADYKHTEFDGDAPGTIFLNKGFEGRVEFAQKKQGPLDGSVGFQVKKRKFEAVGEEAFVPPSETVQWGVFALEKVGFGPLTFEAGARYEHQTAKADAISVDRSDNGLSLSGGISWTPDDDYLVGVSLARTTRLPNAEELFSNGPHGATDAYEIGDVNLKKEVATAAELSFRKRQGRLTGGLSLYHTRYNNFIFENYTGEVMDDLNVIRFTQVDSKFWGGELEMKYSAIEAQDYHVHFDLSADLVRAEIRSTGQPLPRIPPKSLLAGVDVLSRYVDGRVEVRLVDKQTHIASTETETGGYAMLNANLSYRPWADARDVTLELQGKNLTNARALNHVSFLKDMAPLPGRDIRMTLRVGF